MFESLSPKSWSNERNAMVSERILVIGGMGAIGIWVVRELIERGMFPVALDPRCDLQFLSGLEDKFEYVAGDVTDLPRLIHVLREQQIGRIIHLAAILWQCEDNPPLGLAVNTGGTINVLEAARIAGIGRVAFTSAKAVYGQVAGPFGHPEYRPLPEDHPKSPDSIYGATKLAAEHIGLHYARKFGVDFIAMRLATLYGPGRLARHGAVALMSEMVEKARFGHAMRIRQGWEQGDDLLYTRDVASAIVSAALAPAPTDRIFNIGSGRPTTLGEFATVVRELFPGSDIEVGQGLDYWEMGKQYYSVLDVSRAREQLGFTPKFSLKEGVLDYVRWLDGSA
jgi:UDP-glucose 4-epimerase